MHILANFNTFSILNAYFGEFQYSFKVLKTDFEIQYFFNTFNTAWEPCIWLHFGGMIDS